MNIFEQNIRAEEIPALLLYDYFNTIGNAAVYEIFEEHPGQK